MRRILALACASLCWFAAPVFAELPAAEGRTILTVSGSISETNTESHAVFDRAMMEGLDWREIETHTSFTDGVQRFAGPTLASLLDAVGAKGANINATAVNDYTVQIPVAHADAHNVILAMDHNGRTMRVRDKGPIWVVYPISEKEAMKMPFDNEMIWQLDRIEVLN